MFRMILRVCLMLVLSMAIQAQSMAASSLVWFAGKGLVTGKIEGPLTEVVWGDSPLLRLDPQGLLAIDPRAMAVQLIDQQGVVKILMGQNKVTGQEDGSTSEAVLFEPKDVVRGPDGRLYIADSKNFEIRVVDQNGAVSILPVDWAALGADVDTDFCVPNSLAFDAQGHLWVGLSNTGVMLIVDRDGRAKAWEPQKNENLRVLRLASDAQGQVWGMTQNSVGRLKKGGVFEEVVSMHLEADKPQTHRHVAPLDAGPVAALIGKIPFIGQAALPPEPSDISGEIQAPVFQSFAIDERGDVYVRERQHIYRFSAKNQARETLWTESEDRRWAADSSIVVVNGNVLVSSDEGVLYLASSGQLEPYANLFDKQGHVADGAALKRANLNGLEGGALLQSDGSILLLDRLDHVIRRVDTQGKLSIWAGFPDEEGNSNGPRLDARFHYPSDMVQDKVGNLYVADGGNGQIRKISVDGTVSLLAGGESMQERVDGVGTEARFWRTRLLALDEPRNRLFVLDDCPYILCSNTVLRQLDLASGKVTTLVSKESIRTQVGDDVLIRLADRGLFPLLEYEDIVVDANGFLVALGRALGSSIVWRIHPESGRHEVLFAVSNTEKENPSRDKTSDAQEYARQPWKRPVGIEADSLGNVYVSDPGSHTIVRVNSEGIAGIIAGQLGKQGVAEGNLPSVLDSPEALTWTPDGDLMIVMANKGLMLLKQPQLAPIHQAIPSFLEK